MAEEVIKSIKPQDADRLYMPGSDQVGVDSSGRASDNDFSGTGSTQLWKEGKPVLSMNLTKEEEEVLKGSKGETMAKVMRTVVALGEVFGAEELVELSGNPHSSLYFGVPYLDSLLSVFEEIVDAGLKTHARYTINPDAYDLYTIEKDEVRAQMALVGLPLQQRLQKIHAQLGGYGLNKWSCACYTPEVGNRPKTGEAVSWAESSAVNYGNSALGIRVNRMATGMELICAIAGRVPKFGLVTDEGRQAKWHVDVQLSEEPHWGILGGAIGTMLVEDVPFITGVDQWLHGGLENNINMGKLKAMGSATASAGGIGLYHVENITPEAKEKGRNLLIDDPRTYVIDDEEYKRVISTFKNKWKDPNGDPTRVFIGCPHNTFEELHYWAEKMLKALKDAGQEKFVVPVNFAQAGVVKDHFIDEHPILHRDMVRAGAEYTNICSCIFAELAGYDKIERPVTNSNKARYYTNMRLFEDDDLVKVALTGKTPY